MSHIVKHVGLGNCYEATPPLMCSECRASLGYPFDLERLDREMDADGIGWAPSRARGLGLHPPVTVFVRNDDWSLGAGHPAAEELAEESYHKTWALFARESEGWRLRPFSEYDGWKP